MRLGPVSGTIITLALLSPASGALPPQYQRAAELQAAIGATAGPLGEIDRVEYLSTDLYRVTSGRCHMDVRIVSVKSQGDEVVAGPRAFTAEPSELVCP